MSVLSDEEIDHVYSACRGDTFGQVRMVDFARKLEEKILGKLAMEGKITLTRKGENDVQPTE